MKKAALPRRSGSQPVTAKRKAAGKRPAARATIRANLTQAALRLFRQSGYERVTTIEIAQKAGVSPRTFFRYFPTKEDILLVWLDGYADQMFERLSRRPAKETLREALRRALDPYCNLPKESQEQTYFIEDLAQSSASLRGGVWERLALWEQRLATILRRRLKKDPDGSFRAKLLAGLAMRALMYAVMESRQDRRRRSVDQLLDVAFAMLFHET